MFMKKKLLNLGMSGLCSARTKHFFAILICFLGSVSYGQELIPAAQGGFENGATFSANGWTEIQSTASARKWRVGTIATAHSGTNAAYAGAAANYNGSNTSQKSHFYRDVAIPVLSGGQTASLSFWLLMPTIESGWDYLRVYKGTSSSPIPVGDVLPTTGYTQVYSNTSTTYAAWTKVSLDFSAYSGTTVRVVFTFDNDFSTGSPNANPAIDDVSLLVVSPVPPNCASGYSPATLATGVVLNPTLSWAAATGNPTSYDVYFGTASTPPLVGNQTGLTYTPAAPLLANTTYYWKVVAKNSFGSATGCTTQSFTTGSSLTYCTPTYSSGCSNGIDIISKVVLNTLTNTSTCGGYVFYNAVTVPNVARSSSTTVSITFGNDGTQYAGAWIDFNQNGTFEPSEGVVSTSNTAANGTVNLTFAVPATAVLGNTRMRVRGGDDVAMTTSQACGASNDTFGEGEDYIVNITAALPTTQCATLTAPANGATNVGANGNLVLSWTAPASGPVPTSYDLYIGTTAGNPGFLANYTTTSVNLTGFAINTTYYWKIVPKSPSGNDSTTCTVQSFTTGNPFLPYCYTGVTYTSSIEPITLVNFAGINRSSSATVAGSPALENYIADVANVTTESSYTMTLKGNTDGSFTNNFRVFVDWNHDGDMVDAGEIITAGSVANSTGTDAISAVTTITIPATALAGNTRMRVKKIYNLDSNIANIDNPCVGGQYGQTEDYTINVSLCPGQITWYRDADNDGFGNPAVTTVGCAQPTGYVSNSTDCDDTTVRYADVDGDGFGSQTVKVACGGVTDHSDCDDSTVRYADVDGDLFGSQTVKVACGGVLDHSDCDDNTVRYADVDGDGFGSQTVKVACGGVTDHSDCDDNTVRYADVDGDLFGSQTVKVACGGVLDHSDCDDSVVLYADADGDGFGSQTVKVACGGVTNNTDCNDSQLQYVDADSDGFGSTTLAACGVSNNTDCNDAQLQYVDADADGFGSTTLAACGVTNNSDCNDSQLQYVDADSDGFGSTTLAACGVSNNADCNDAQLQYVDADADGFGSTTLAACGVTNNSDCNDAVVYYQDSDNDGFGSNVKVACGTVTNNSDCDDNQVRYADADGDGYGTVVKVACGGSINSTDCDDSKASVNPGATEIGYNLIDDDCDGLIDEGFPPKNTTITGGQCNTLLPAIDTQLIANLVPGAQGYQWRVTTLSGPTNGQVQTLNTLLRVMRLTQLANYA
ncbi:MAG: hypothetical protein EOO51_14560, partial [Flavobacterium sp.]